MSAGYKPGPDNMIWSGSEYQNELWAEDLGSVRLEKIRRTQAVMERTAGMYRILMVDDDRELLKMLGSYFELKGYRMSAASDGREALEKLVISPDIILLDVNMPGMDGIELCRQIRDKVSCPILFLTARAEEKDRVNGLLSGGDDYILKPFSLKELDARITAHLKREERRGAKTDLKFADGMTIDFTARRIWVGETEIGLTRTEFDIVEFLSMNPGQVFDRERIYEKICGYEAEGDSRSVTELIRRIRGKLAACTDKEYIETVWGIGYRWKK